MNRVHRDELDGVNEDRPPAGTAIVRPLQHVAAVRECHLEQLAARSLGAESRSARAWSWALGETSVAPVTDRATAVPPSKTDIEVEVAEADKRRDRAEHEGRADGAARVLRWLIGTDDHLPVRGLNRGKLVGGFGEVVRSQAEIADLLSTMPGHANDGAKHSDPDYRDGVAGTLMWVLNRQIPAPVTGKLTPELTTRDLKVERLHAQDLDVHGNWSSECRLSNSYGVGVSRTLDWLLGHS